MKYYNFTLSPTSDQERISISIQYQTDSVENKEK